MHFEARRSRTGHGWRASPAAGGIAKGFADPFAAAHPELAANVRALALAGNVSTTSGSSGAHEAALRDAIRVSRVVTDLRADRASCSLTRATGELSGARLADARIRGASACSSSGGDVAGLATGATVRRGSAATDRAAVATDRATASARTPAVLRLRGRPIQRTTGHGQSEAEMHAHDPSIARGDPWQKRV